ncbi:hypothetical protein MANES_18G124650v8 [Manihot esculenta]|uniref:Uncharacterized protein n=2 Tax=Manihot esculenta TaxID=3983 RepID=A0ACB7G1N4_MANES|nr:hypothetical protein MANES_18G124650v8 [Manihot esculenta]KAG8633824.1 hypothetical protein MANES_18G124650v8 [Manihot esculenta]
MALSILSFTGSSCFLSSFTVQFQLQRSHSWYLGVFGLQRCSKIKDLSVQKGFSIMGLITEDVDSSPTSFSSWSRRFLF